MMLLDEVVYKHRRELVRAARVALWSSVWWTKARTRTRAPQEPDFIAGLTLISSHVLSHLWRPIFARKGVGLKIISAFTHQSPRVRFSQGPHPNGKSGCELGDILFVHIHDDGSGKLYKNALLLQAKKAQSGDGLPHTIGRAERHQLDLYLRWFGFQLKREDYHISPPAPHLGAQYLWIDDFDMDCRHCCKYWKRDFGESDIQRFVDEHYPDACCCKGYVNVVPLPYVIAFPDETLRFSCFLDEGLVRLLTGTIGREYDEEAVWNDDWSKLIENLLEYLERRNFTRRNVDVRGAERLRVLIFEKTPNVGLASLYSVDDLINDDYYSATVILNGDSLSFLGLSGGEEPPQPPEGTSRDELDGRDDIDISMILIKTYPEQG